MANNKELITGNLLKEIRSCHICDQFLDPNPIVTFHSQSKIVIVGQAPGRKVHESGKPWDDRSGDILRSWLGIDKRVFYDEKKIALVPMGFCYPGKSKSGDLPPRPECADAWHNAIFEKLGQVRLTILVGQYAQKHYLKSKAKKNLTETVKNYESYLPGYFPVPHPSPRNGIWLRRNSWFEEQVLEKLQALVGEIV